MEIKEKVRNKKWTEDELFAMRKEVLAQWPTGSEVNLEEAIEYHKQIEAKVAFPPRGELKDTLSQVLASNNLKQAKIVESEKAVHVAFYLNGEVEGLIPGEERIIIPSPKGLKDYT